MSISWIAYVESTVIPPPTPPDEEARLAELRSLGVLDTAAEERFDRFTRLARRLFGVPIALVSLVDEDRQWFKSKQGLDVCETGRDVSFCGHAILGSEVLVIEDAREDERFADNPLVTGESNVVFYAGYPIVGPRGGHLGTLCLIDDRPRTFSDEDRQALTDLGQMVSSELCAVQLATSDPLTGLTNRRGFSAMAQQAVAVAHRHGAELALAVLDLDGFKEVNDTFGHEQGDRALVDFARMLQEVFRTSDTVARTGGDEFCVMLVGTDLEGGQRALDRLQRLVDTHHRDAGTRWKLAFSAGLVAYDRQRHRGLPGLMNEADAVMYEVKRQRKAA